MKFVEIQNSTISEIIEWQIEMSIQNAQQEEKLSQLQAQVDNLSRMISSENNHNFKNIGDAGVKENLTMTITSIS